MAGLPEVAVGAVVASLIAGVISLLGLIVSKEQKVSEFRQAWIDALRTELATFIAHANALFIASASADLPDKYSEVVRTLKEDFIATTSAAAKIRLRVNPKEVGAQAVLAGIETLERQLDPRNARNYAVIEEAQRQLVSAAQSLLKKEWMRVRRGERVYRIAKFLALVVTVASVLGLLVSLAKMS
jgi:hypothetical protein